MNIFGRKTKAADPALLAHIILARQELEKINEECHKTNVLLEDTIRAIKSQGKSYDDFSNIIQNFFAIQKRLSLEEEKRKMAKEVEFDMLPADLRY